MKDLRSLIEITKSLITSQNFKVISLTVVTDITPVVLFCFLILCTNAHVWIVLVRNVTLNKMPYKISIIVRACLSIQVTILKYMKFIPKYSNYKYNLLNDFTINYLNFYHLKLILKCAVHLHVFVMLIHSVQFWTNMPLFKQRKDNI